MVFAQEYITITNSYFGLNFDNLYACNTNYIVASGYINGLISIPNVGFNAYANPASFSRSGTSTFGLTSLYATAAWNDGLSVRFDGYDASSAVVATLTITANTKTPTLVVFDSTFAAVNKVLITTSGGSSVGYSGIGTHVAIDNVLLTFN
jgi:hypothetical protein